MLTTQKRDLGVLGDSLLKALAQQLSGANKMLEIIRKGIVSKTESIIMPR